VSNIIDDDGGVCMERNCLINVVFVDIVIDEDGSVSTGCNRV
jgi:hypothetical protein